MPNIKGRRGAGILGKKIFKATGLISSEAIAKHAVGVFCELNACLKIFNLSHMLAGKCPDLGPKKFVT
jgi:hypothetical protein